MLAVSTSWEDTEKELVEKTDFVMTDLVQIQLKNVF